MSDQDFEIFIKCFIIILFTIYIDNMFNGNNNQSNSSALQV